MAIPESTAMAQRQRPAQVIAVKRAAWHSEPLADGRLHAAGNVDEARRLATAIATTGTATGIADILRGQRGHFGFILDLPDLTLAATDACRTQPLFHAAASAERIIVANDAWRARDAAGLTAYDPATVVEFAMAGYVTGGDTVIDGLHQLEAGSFLRVDAAGVTQQRYYRHLPVESAGDPAIDWPERLREALDSAFATAVARNAERPVMVPISGGYDSRLILCKLHEHGCRDLTAFSYGTPGNTDADAGRAVAAALDVPWHFVPSDGVRARRFFDSDARRDYWRFADGLSTIPNFQDYQALQDLRRIGVLPDDAVIINGQTGDFLSGGHILKTVAEGTTGADALTAALIDKHFSLWRQLDSPANRATLASRISSKLDSVRPGFGSGGDVSWPDVMALCQFWEFDERQAKYVINGQRIYEHLGLGWELPLWDYGLVTLFRDMPAELKLGQRLYLETLRNWNYRGLFAGHRRPASSWPAGMRFMAPAEAAVRRLFGGAAQRRFNRYARWFGHYHHQYREMTLPVFLRTAGDARNLLSLHARTWLAESGASPSPFDLTETA